jgi:hypothetical protein
VSGNQGAVFGSPRVFLGTLQIPRCQSPQQQLPTRRPSPYPVLTQWVHQKPSQADRQRHGAERVPHDQPDFRPARRRCRDVHRRARVAVSIIIRQLLQALAIDHIATPQTLLAPCPSPLLTRPFRRLNLARCCQLYLPNFTYTLTNEGRISIPAAVTPNSSPPNRSAKASASSGLAKQNTTRSLSSRRMK